MAHCPTCHRDGVSREHVDTCADERKMKCKVCFPPESLSLSLVPHSEIDLEPPLEDEETLKRESQRLLAQISNRLPDSSAPFRAMEATNEVAATILRKFRTLCATARVLIPVSNEFGHKASSIVVAKRLVELRACECVVIQCEDVALEEPVEKLLSTIHPTLRWGADVVVNGVTVVALSMRKVCKIKFPEPCLGFSGGYDSSIQNLCSALKVKHAIMLQPPNWKSRCQLSLKLPWRCLGLLQTSPFFVGAIGTPQLLLAYDACPYVDMSMFTRGVLLCPVYGTHHPSVTEHALPCIVSALQSLCEKLGRRGVVVVMNGAKLKRPVLPEGADELVDYGRHNVAQWVSHKGTVGRVLVCRTGQLSPMIFDMLMAYCNLPYFFEGAGTLSLAFNLGKPYIRFLGNDMDRGYIPYLEGHETTIRRLEMLGDNVAFHGDKADTRSALYYYFMFCVIRPADAGRYFQALRKLYHRATRDKVFRSLLMWVASSQRLDESGILKLVEALDAPKRKR